MANVVATYVTLKHVLDDGTVIEQNFRVNDMNVRQNRRVTRKRDGSLQPDPLMHLSVAGFVDCDETKH